MNSLTVSSAMAESFPSLFEGLKKAQTIFESIKSFEDVERVFLLGQGLSPHTYRSYLTAVKQFYGFTKDLNLLQVRPGDIKAFYDSLIKRTDRNTAYLRIKGLKKFYAGIKEMIPFYKNHDRNRQALTFRSFSRRWQYETAGIFFKHGRSRGSGKAENGNA